VGTEPDSFALSMDELRIVARYAVESAEDVLTIFEQEHPDDRRPRAAIDAAWTFAGGANRTRLQRTTALDAHRAAKDATTEAAKHAAHAAGDAASAAYLHPPAALPGWKSSRAKAAQVGHILRAAAHAARAAELSAGGDPRVGDQRIEQARRRATHTLADVLRRYPVAPVGKSRVAQLMKALDTSVRFPKSTRPLPFAEHLCGPALSDLRCESQKEPN
jgi:hypothetical protein